MSKRKMISAGIKYGALAGFVCAELFLVGFATIYALGGVFGYGPATPNLGVTLFLFGQAIGVLPATLLGALVGGVVGLLFAQFPTLVARHGAWWGVLCAFGLYWLLSELLAVVFPAYFVDYEFFTLIAAIGATPRLWDDEFLLSALIIFLFYLGAGAWAGSKLGKLQHASL